MKITICLQSFLLKRRFLQQKKFFYIKYTRLMLFFLNHGVHGPKQQIDYIVTLIYLNVEYKIHE